MSDVLKLTDEELKSLQGAIGKLNESKLMLGEINTQAHLMQLQVLELGEALGKVQKELEEKYGSISVDISSGEYEAIVEEAKTVE